MRQLRAWFLRLASLLRRERSERDLAEEMNSLVEMHVEKHLGAGMTYQEAHRRALIELGGVESVKEKYRDRRGIPVLEAAAQDLRYGLRMLRRSPGFTAIAVLALGLGIGANTAIFSVVYGVLLRPLPYPEAERVALVYAHFSPQDIEHGTMSIADFLDWKEANTAFQEPALINNSGWRFNIASSSQPPEQISACRVTPGFFSTLQAVPLFGRVLEPGEDSAAAQPVAVLSESLWRRRFGADPHVIGQPIGIEGNQATIIGVMPASFRFWPDTEMWMNLRISPPTRRGPYPWIGIARLKSGVTFQQAQSETDGIARRIEDAYPKSYSHLSFPVVPLREALVGDARPALLVMLGAVAFVLLIAIVNVANLLLARASVREREIAVRIALGAGRGRIVRQLLTESALLAAFGGAGGFALAFVGIRLLRSWNPGNLPRIEEIRLDSNVLIFTFLISLVTGIVFGLAPALQASRAGFNSALREGGRGATTGAGRRRTRSLLVTAEIALSLVLLIGAGLLLRSFVLLQHVQTGVHAPLANVLTMQIGLNSADYADPNKGAAFYDRLLERLRESPGVQAIAISSSLPPDRRWDWDTFQIEGQPWTQERFPAATCPVVSADYFRALGIPLLKGRLFDERDRPNAPPVRIISQTLAEHYFGGEDPIGKHIKQSGPDLANPWEEIVGVVGDVKYTGLHGEPEPVYYQPAPQAFDNRMFLVARTGTAATAMAETLRKQIQEIDPSVVISRIAALDEIASESVAQPRFRTSLLAVFAAVALALAAIGVYGVMSYLVAQRTNEIGIRVALGARRVDVLRLVLGQGLRLIQFGLVIGIIAAFWLTRLISSLLFGVSAADPLTFGGVAALLAFIALFACYIPARRAMRVDPITALRSE